MKHKRMMDIFHKQFDEVKELLNYDDFILLTKRVIDFALDTEDISHYQEVADLLDWIDTNEADIPAKKQKFVSVLDNLYQTLSKKQQHSLDSQTLITVNKLVKTYASKGQFQLGPISFELHAGEILGLVGENGNGKTTLLRSLCGELNPSNGTISYSFPYKNRYDLRSKLIYIPQRTDSWSGALLTNLRFTAASYGFKDKENELMVELVIARLGLRKFRDYNWKDLSSGYKMRFELARALLRRPRLLLIDEPLANLDILAQQVVLDDFRDIARSIFRPIGIVLSSQQLYEVEKTSDNVIFLKNGVPKERINKQSQDAEPSVLVVEFEVDYPQQQLRELLKAIQVENLQINGGTYVAHFPHTVKFDDFLRLLIDNHVAMTYVRNISQSTRRYFVSDDNN